MNPRTLNAIKELAGSEYEVEVNDDRVELKSESVRTEAHKLDNGRWILARWNERNCQWQSGDVPRSVLKANPGFCYAFARTLEGLADEVNTYRSPVAALKSALDWR